MAFAFVLESVFVKVLAELRGPFEAAVLPVATARSEGLKIAMCCFAVLSPCGTWWSLVMWTAVLFHCVCNMIFL